MPLKFNNPNKDLVPLNSTSEVFWNRNAVEIRSDFAKGQPEYKDFFYVGDQPLTRLGGMTYWYGIGDRQFDIREMRELGKLKQTEYKADKQFCNPFASLKLVAFQLARISAKQNLPDFLEKLLYPIEAEK